MTYILLRNMPRPIMFYVLFEPKQSYFTRVSFAKLLPEIALKLRGVWRLPPTLSFVS